MLGASGGTMSVPMAVPGVAWSLVAVIIVLLQASSARGARRGGAADAAAALFAP
jgi:hypothetical protein